MEAVIGKLKIILPHSYCAECLHTCSNAFRMVKRVGKGSHGQVFMGLHVPTMKIYAIKRIRNGTGLQRSALKNELKALLELCRDGNVNNDITKQEQQTTLLVCKKCAREFGFERFDKNIWVAESDSSEELSPCESCSSVPHLSCSLNALLDVKTDIFGLPKICRCPYVVHFFDSFPDSSPDGQCLVLEYMRWGSLQEVLSNGRVLSEDEIAVVAYSVLKALLYMNDRNYIHRDIKASGIYLLASPYTYRHSFNTHPQPGNILMDSAGRVKLADFGTACTLDHVPKQQVSSPTEGPLVGTLAYMPPERFKPNSPHSVKGDLWSLGVTLVHLLRGKHPFSEKLGYWELRNLVATTPVEHILRHDDECSPELADFLSRCVVRRVNQRATVQELLQSAFLQRIAATNGTIPATTSMGAEAGLNTPVIAAAAVGAAVGGAVGGAATAAESTDARAATPEQPARVAGETEVPRLTALVQSLQDDEITVAVLKIVSSIVAEATAPEEDFSWKITALSEQLGLPSEVLESMVREARENIRWDT